MGSEQTFLPRTSCIATQYLNSGVTRVLSENPVYHIMASALAELSSEKPQLGSRLRNGYGPGFHACFNLF